MAIAALNHVAVTVSDIGVSGPWYRALIGADPVLARLDELGIAHGGVVDAHYGSGLSFRDPDGVALEFFAPPE